MGAKLRIFLIITAIAGIAGMCVGGALVIAFQHTIHALFPGAPATCEPPPSAPSAPARDTLPEPGALAPPGPAETPIPPGGVGGPVPTETPIPEGSVGEDTIPDYLRPTPGPDAPLPGQVDILGTLVDPRTGETQLSYVCQGAAAEWHGEIHVLTASHCTTVLYAEKDTPMYVVWRGRRYRVTDIAWGTTGDVARVKAEAPFESDVRQAGAALRVGAGPGVEASMNSRRVGVAYARQELGMDVYIAADGRPPEPGDSGSPVLNARGELAAVVVAYGENGELLAAPVRGQRWTRTPEGG